MIILFTLVFIAAVSVSAHASSYLTSNGYYFWMEDDEAVAIHGCDSSKTSLYFPVMLGNAFITSIDDNAFLKNEAISSVEFAPLSRITRIGDGAFYGCAGIESVALPQGVARISESIFQNCVSLRSVTLGSETQEIDAQAFYNCRSLQTVSMPEEIDSIGNLAFANCPALMYLELPRNITSIAPTAFYKDTNLTLGVYYNSYAYKFAKENGIAYVLLDNPVLGDANGDETVSIGDVTAIQRHLADLEQLEGIYLIAADINCSGSLDVDDATDLQKYLAKFDISASVGQPIKG